ncbi:hypothetical protein [Sphingomonas sp. UYEF23]|uniref:hypothetical protein n=1 Tax=Sphingomonas sp. UYEF23 TaxID=1756408 RepID=UPI00339879B4
MASTPPTELPIPSEPGQPDSMPTELPSPTPDVVVPDPAGDPGGDPIAPTDTGMTGDFA